jgi:hypothetical protein
VSTITIPPRFIMSNGEISGNTANWGGGVLVKGGVFEMTGGSITGNKSSSTAPVTNGGGGVKLSSSTFTMSG